MLPELIRQLPLDMDVALVFQAMVQSPDELADDIAECLCLELREMLRFQPLESATDKTLFGRLVTGLSLLEAAAFKGIPSKWVPELTDQQTPPDPKEWARNTKILKNAGARKDFGGLVERALAGKPGIWEKAHSRYAALREHLHSVLPEKTELYLGMVLSRQNPDDGKTEWRVCLTPACDCARGKLHEHLFVRGFERKESQFPEGRGVRTSIHSGKHEIELKWIVSTFHTEKCPPTGPDGWIAVTILRDPFAQKIVQSLWGFQSRIGVNTSELLRIERDEKE
jgi:hypothetical protein